MPRVVFIFCALCLGCSSLARAHDPGLSSVNVVVSPRGVELTGTFAANDARWLTSEDGKSVDVNAPDFPSKLERAAGSLWVLSNAGDPLPLRKTHVAATPGNNIEIKEEFAAPRPGALSLNTRVFELLPAGHREHATLTEAPDRLVAAKLFSASDHEISHIFAKQTAAAESVSGAPADAVSFVAFLKLGVEHILTGYDHLLFLFAFLITARGIKPILKIITSFTVAHSITLGLSALNIVYIPSRIIEPLIAATIVFVALQNLFRRNRLGERAALTFAFGLIHGFGFAAVLRDMGIASLGSSAWRALAGFNLGVEIGQIAVASLVLPLLWFIRSRPLSRRSWTPAASALIAAAGIFWFIQRVSGT